MFNASIEFIIFLYLIVILSAVFHEYAHAYAAYSMGDPTAKNMGRLTLNPIAHIDPIGTVLLPLFLIYFFNFFIGYAKPVPYNPYNLNDQKYGEAKVAGAGPLANFIIAFVLSLVLRFIDPSTFAYIALTWIIYINIFLALFNLIPVPPLDGSKILASFVPAYHRFNLIGGSFIAIFIAIIILPSISGFFYNLIVGSPFSPIAF